MTTYSKPCKTPQDTPVEPDDTADEVKAKVVSRALDHWWYSVYREALEQSPPPDAFSRAELLTHTYRGWNLTATFGNWLGNRGWDVRPVEAADVGSKRLRYDLRATHPDEGTLIAEVRAAVRTLDSRGARAISERFRATADQARRALVFAEGTVVTPDAIQMLREHGIEAYVVSSDSEDLDNAVTRVI